MPRNELISASKKIHEILLESIKISDYCFGKPGFFGAMRNLFRKLDFASSSVKLQGYMVNLDFCLNGIKAIQVESVKEKDYIASLILFTEALKNSIEKMNVVIQALALKAEGGELPYNDYNFLFKQYDEANVKRGIIGDELNRSYQELMKG